MSDYNQQKDEDNLSQEEFASMLEESFNDTKSQTVTTGTIISISEDSVLVDVGEKVEGRINISEITDESGELTHNSGDKISIILTGFRNERPVISHQKALKKEKVQKFIESLGEDYTDKVVEGKVVKKNKGGYIVESEGNEFFMPKYLSSIKEDSKPIGKNITACIINVKKEDDSIIISRKRWFEIEWKEKKDKIEELLKKEEPLVGKVKKITSFGMFIDIDGVEGLVHYTEISYKGPINPSKHFQIDDVVHVKILNYDENKRRLSLSIKATMEDPWNEIKEELETGDTIEVMVSNLEPYGAFVDLGNDIEGFLHISEISWDKNIKHPSEYLEIGKKIHVEVIEIDGKDRKLRVSLKKMQPKPFDQFLSDFKEGDKIEGEVVSLTDFGAFIRIGTIDGLLHNEDAFWGKNEKCKEVFKRGDKVEVEIGKIDRDKERVSLTRKSLIQSPAEEYGKKHKIDDIVNGTIRDIKEFGVFINLEDDVDALIRNEDLAPLKKEELKSGDEIEAVLSAIDARNNRIRASIKRLERKKEKEDMKEFNGNNDSDKMTLGDIIKDQI